MTIETKKEDFIIRFAAEDDVLLILNFIKELAEYEKLLSEVVATEGNYSAIFRKILHSF